MARATLKKKSKAGKEYACDRCTNKIVAGEQYYMWSFRYGGTHFQHASHGMPKFSQLTQSKMSGAYRAIEDCEATLQSCGSASEVADALGACIEEIGNVRDEYQEAIDAMVSPDGVVGQNCQEAIDNLESFISELEEAQQEAENAEEPDDDDDQDAKAALETALADCISKAEEALGSASF
jgi:hypothetical protein